MLFVGESERKNCLEQFGGRRSGYALPVWFGLACTCIYIRRRVFTMFFFQCFFI